MAARTRLTSTLSPRPSAFVSVIPSSVKRVKRRVDRLLKRLQIVFGQGSLRYTAGTVLWELNKGLTGESILRKDSYKVEGLLH